MRRSFDGAAPPRPTRPPGLAPVAPDPALKHPTTPFPTLCSPGDSFSSSSNPSVGFEVFIINPLLQLPWASHLSPFAAACPHGTHMNARAYRSHPVDDFREIFISRFLHLLSRSPIILPASAGFEFAASRLSNNHKIYDSLGHVAQTTREHQSISTGKSPEVSPALLTNDSSRVRARPNPTRKPSSERSFAAAYSVRDSDHLIFFPLH